MPKSYDYYQCKERIRFLVLSGEDLAISSLRFIVSTAQQFHPCVSLREKRDILILVSLRVERGNLVKKEQNSLCAKRARTGDMFSGEGQYA
jgi:hypothetical protein